MTVYCNLRPARSLAWATASRSNGLITRWSLAHLTSDGQTTLCGKNIPAFTKQVELDSRPKCRKCRDTAVMNGDTVESIQCPDCGPEAEVKP